MKVLKLVALSYLVKTVLVGIAWFFIPDLPDRAVSLARRSWSWIQTAPAAAEASPAAAAVTPPR